MIFNSCCHGGADNIVREVADTFPGQPISAIVGASTCTTPPPRRSGPSPTGWGDRGNPSNHRTLHRARGPGHPDPGLGQPGAAPLHRVGADLLTAAETYMYSQKTPLIRRKSFLLIRGVCSTHPVPSGDFIPLKNKMLPSILSETVLEVSRHGSICPTENAFSAGEGFDQQRKL